MNLVYPTHKAKARFAEVIRLVRAGRTIQVSYHGKPVAEIRPIGNPVRTIEEHLDDLERRGIVSPPAAPGPFVPGPVTRRPGGLERFLAERAE